MPRQETIENWIWADADFAALTPPAKFLYIWSFTTAHCNMAGLYKVGHRTMAFETGHDLAVIESALEELEQANFLYYDGAVMWVRTRVKRITSRTKQIATSIAKDVARLHPHPYVERFLSAYGSQAWLREALSEMADKHGDFPSLSEALTSRSKSMGSCSEEKTTLKATSELDAHALSRDLFGYWQQKCGHANAKPTRDRMHKVRARLAEGYSAEDVRLAIDGAARAAFVSDDGKRFDDLELICRRGSKLEDFMGRASHERRPRNGSRPGTPPMGMSGEEYGRRMESKGLRSVQERLAAMTVGEREEFERCVAASREAM